MYKLIGEKSYFAIEVDVTQNKWDNATCLWLNGYRVGEWEDRNLIAPFYGSLKRIIENPEKLEYKEMQSRSCRELFLLLYPNFEKEEAYTYFEQNDANKLATLRQYHFFWGENFDSTYLSVLYNDGICKFLWAQKNDKKEVENYLYHCCDIKWNVIENSFLEFMEFISPFITFTY